MRKYLVIAACLGFLLFAGCNRCGMWDWYSPCDLVEGAGRQPVCNPCDGGGGPCGGWTSEQNWQPCDPCGPQAGQVMKTEWAYTVAPCTPPAPPPAAMPEVVTPEPAK